MSEDPIKTTIPTQQLEQGGLYRTGVPVIGFTTGPRPTAVMEVQSGTFIDVFNPDPALIKIEDIAHGLSHLCRFGGHTVRHYSVAEHSWWVSQQVPEEFALQGLMHDATEAYLVDIPTPIKKHFPMYYEVEKRLHAAICERFGVDPAMPGPVKEADARMCITEKICLISEENLDHPEWRGLTDHYSAYDDVVIQRKTVHPLVARNMFLNRFEELGGRA